MPYRVAEAPGAEEAVQGGPFVAPASRSGVARDAGIDAEQVRLANAIPFRPIASSKASRALAAQRSRKSIAMGISAHRYATFQARRGSLPSGAQRLAWAESAVIHAQTALETLEEAFRSTKGVTLVLATNTAFLGPTVDASGRSIGS